VKSAALLYRLLGDEARLRLLRVLAKERLNVTELTGVLGLAQSGVSRHLGLLKDADLVVEERDGGFSYYRLAAGLREGSLAGVLQQQFEESAADAAVRADEARLQEVLRLRKENFDAHAGPDTRDARQLVPGRSWAAWSRALGLLLPRLAVADLGCGEGYLTVEAARWASKVASRRHRRRSASEGSDKGGAPRRRGPRGAGWRAGLGAGQRAGIRRLPRLRRQAVRAGPRDAGAPRSGPAAQQPAGADPALRRAAGRRTDEDGNQSGLVFDGVRGAAAQQHGLVRLDPWLGVRVGS